MTTTRLERWLERWMLKKPFTARRAAVAIAVVTLGVTVAAGLLITVLDPKDFDNVWVGLWWAIQTVTTVGYGDVTPKSAWGRVLAGVVMITGIGFLTVVTAAITAALVEGARRRRGAGFGDDPLATKLDEMNARLEALEALLRSGDGGRAPAAGPPPR
jgi:voltage-gated potassium channel